MRSRELWVIFLTRFKVASRCPTHIVPHRAGSPSHSQDQAPGQFKVLRTSLRMPCATKRTKRDSYTYPSIDSVVLRALLLRQIRGIHPFIHNQTPTSALLSWSSSSTASLAITQTTASASVEVMYERMIRACFNGSGSVLAPTPSLYTRRSVARMSKDMK